MSTPMHLFELELQHPTCPDPIGFKVWANRDVKAVDQARSLLSTFGIKSNEYRLVSLRRVAS